MQKSHIQIIVHKCVYEQCGSCNQNITTSQQSVWESVTMTASCRPLYNYVFLILFHAYCRNWSNQHAPERLLEDDKVVSSGAFCSSLECFDAWERHDST